MKQPSRAWLAQAVLAVAALIGALSLLVAVGEIGQPFAGFLPAWRPPDKWVLDNGTPPWWPALTQTGLRNADALLALNGQSLALAQNTLAQAALSGASNVTLRVLRDGVQTEITVPLQRFTLGHMLEVKAAEIINGLTLLLIGILILRTRPNDPLNRSAAIACGIFSLNQGLWHAALGGVFAPANVLLTAAWALATPLVGPALLSFGLRFVQTDATAPLPLFSRILRALAWGLGIALALGLIATRLFFWPAQLPNTGVLEAILYRSTIVFTFGGVMLVMALLSINLLARKTQTARTRQQWLVIMLGFLVALPALLVHFLSLLSDRGSFYVLGGLDLRALYLAIPLALSIAILRYQTFKSEIPLQLGLAVLVASAILASIGDWLLRMAAPRETQFVLPPFSVLFVLLFGAFSAYQLLSSRSMPRVFRWRSTSYGAVRLFGEQLAAQNDMTQLPATIVESLIALLNLEHAALWLWDEPTRTYARAGRAMPDTTAMLDSHTIRSLETQPGTPLRLNGSPDGLEAAICLRSTAGMPQQGLLALGKRKDEEIFHERDFEVIELIAQQAALSLATAQQMHALRQVPQQVANAQERERFHIAQELHDTVQQFLGRLPFQIETSRSMIASNPVAAQARFAQMIDDVSQAARTVREIRSNLAPIQLQRGFAQPVRDLVAQVEAHSELVINASIDDAIDRVLSEQQRHALYRVLQQALDNIEAHAEAKHVAITIENNAHAARVTLDIRDDGRGFIPEQAAAAAQAGHLGLRSMHARLAALGGDLRITAVPGEGAHIAGWLPLDAEL